MKKNKIYARVKKNEYIRDKQHIVLGLSGGPDSVCLFSILLELSDEMDLSIHPVHVNHMIRGQAAESDMRYCEKLCKDRGIQCSVFSFDCIATAEKLGITTEEAGRLKRYEYFSDIACKIRRTGVPRELISIATAHNADDQVETILFRLLRGTGIDGLAGMREIRTDERGFTVIKPLLGVWKKDIVAYCQEKSLNPCSDHTNEEPVYDRNRIRLDLIPYLEKYNPNISEAILRLGKAAREDSDLLNAMAAQEDSGLLNAMAAHIGESDRLDQSEHVSEPDHIGEPDHMGEPGYIGEPDHMSEPDHMGEPYEISCENIFENPPALWKRRVVGILKRLGLSEDLQASHFAEMEKLAKSYSPSASVNLPRGYAVRKSYDRIIFSRPGKPAEKIPKMSCASVEKKKLAQNRGNMPRRGDMRADAAKNGMHAEFDQELLEKRFGKDFREKLSLRTRKSGDYMLIKGCSGRKKIQNLFVDEKIPREKRGEIYMVAIGSEILFIPASSEVFKRGKYSGGYSVCEDTKKVFCIEIVKGV